MAWFISWPGSVPKCHSWPLNVCGSKTMPARLEKVNYSVIDEILSFSTYVNVMGICFWSHHSLSNTNSVCDPCTLTFYTICRFLTREAIGRTSHSFSKTLELLTWIPIFFTFWFCKENEFILPQRVPVYIRLPWVNIIHTYCFNIHRDWNSNISV